MSTLELRIHPPIILLVCGLLAWLIARMAKSFEVGGAILTVFAVVSVAVGIVIAASAILQFHRARTTIEPTKPTETSTLVTSGVYRVTRNPMYLALLLVLSGWVMFLGNIASVVVLFVFVAYISRFQIGPEERILASKFGEAYSIYRRQVRRWI